VYANQMMLKLDNGGKGMPVPCYFCEESIVKILEHMQSKHEVEVGLMFAVEKRIIGAQMIIGQFRSHIVVRVTWFRNNNYLVWWQGKGVLIPHRRTNAVKDPSKMIFCSYCCTLIEKAPGVLTKEVAFPFRACRTSPVSGKTASYSGKCKQNFEFLMNNAGVKIC
jgi:hypothetical protein